MQNVYLIGLMGAGKTTVGKKVAAITGRPFVDTDQDIIARTGVSIQHIFEVEGEKGFRDRETDSLMRAGESGNSIVSTGGGIVLREQNVKIMQSTGIVVYLEVPFGILWNRLKGCQNRPLLQVANPKEKLKALMDERHPVYQNAATVDLRVLSDSSAKTANKIVNYLNNLPE